MDSPLVSFIEKYSDKKGNGLKWTIQWTYCAKWLKLGQTESKWKWGSHFYDFQLQSHESPGNTFDFRKIWIAVFPVFKMSFVSSSSFIWLILEKIY